MVFRQPVCHLDFLPARRQTSERCATGHAGPGRRGGGGQGHGAGAAVDGHQPWRHQQQSVGVAVVEGGLEGSQRARGPAVPLPPSGSHLPLLQVEVGAHVPLG